MKLCSEIKQLRFTFIKGNFNDLMIGYTVEFQV